MKIQNRKLSSIRPYDRNPRRNDPAVDAVAASIREFGFRQPIVVDADGVIIVGDARFKAALQLGRRAYLMELDPLYCDVIVARYEQFTGRKAERISAEMK